MIEQHPTGNREWNDYEGVREWVSGQLMSGVYDRKDYTLQEHSKCSSPLLVPLIGLTESKFVPFLGVGRQIALHPEIKRNVHEH